METEQNKPVEQQEQLTPQEQKPKKKIQIDWYTVTCIIMALIIAITAVVYIVQISTRDTNAEVNPDATITESTTVPVTDSIPETEETIPETEPPTEPPTEPTIVETKPVDTPQQSSKPSSKPSSESTSTNKKEDKNMSELEMLACVIYQEAGGNSSCDNCRRYVADIVLNRVNDSRFPNTMHEVLTAKNQYGKFYKTGIKWPSRAKNAGEKDAVARAYRIAEEVLNGQHSKLYGEGYIWQASFKQGKSGFWCCGHFYGRS